MTAVSAVKTYKNTPEEILNTPRPDLVKKYTLWIPSLLSKPNAKLIEIYHMVFEELESLVESLKQFKPDEFPREERRIIRKIVCIERLNTETKIIELVDQLSLAIKLAEAKKIVFSGPSERLAEFTSLTVDVACSCCPTEVKKGHENLYDA